MSGAQAKIIVTDQMVLFWHGCFSQWWQSPFAVDGVPAGKARLFGDEVTLQKILAEPNPRKQKGLGRKVAHFQEAKWAQVSTSLAFGCQHTRLALIVAEHCEEIVFRGSLAKFGQNQALLQQLLDTGDRTLVEASPLDTVWGIGLAADDPRAQHPSKWRGRNLLGQCLMRARDELRNVAAPGMGKRLSATSPDLVRSFALMHRKGTDFKSIPR